MKRFFAALLVAAGLTVSILDAFHAHAVRDQAPCAACSLVQTPSAPASQAPQTPLFERCAPVFSGVAAVAADAFASRACARGPPEARS